MITWFQVWPLLLFPYIIAFVVGLFPFVRESALNYLLIPILPYDLSTHLVDWYGTATLMDELAIHLLISINLGTAIYPVFYLIGYLFITVTNSIARSQITSLNNR